MLCFRLLEMLVNAVDDPAPEGEESCEDNPILYIARTGEDCDDDDNPLILFSKDVSLSSEHCNIACFFCNLLCLF